MTADGYLEVDTEALKRAGNGFHTGATSLNAIFQRLDNTLSAEGKCWGQDETGKKFEEGYIEGHDSVLKTFPQFVKGLDGINKGVDQMAKTYKAAEDASRLK